VANVESGETMTSIEHHERPARINRQLMVIGGRSVESSDGRYIDVENPANRTTIGQVPRATADDIDSAVRGAAAAFEAWRLVVPRDRGWLLSPRAIVSFGKAWKVACVAAGCPGRIPHDMRRTAIRNFVRTGTSENVAMKMSGHKTRSVFDRYNVTSPADLREAARRLDAAVTVKVGSR
jgi:hypothetical protein